MGLFRTKKADKYTLAEAEAEVLAAESRVISEVLICRALVDDVGFDLEGVRAALHEWAEWRELLARKHGENDSKLD